MPTIGLEPILLKGKQILSLPCLPIPPSGHKFLFLTLYNILSSAIARKGLEPIFLGHEPNVLANYTISLK